jgi:hypothetical protein
MLKTKLVSKFGNIGSLLEFGLLAHLERCEGKQKMPKEITKD